MTDRCPHCDSLVSISTGEEGTSCYVSPPEEAIREALDELAGRWRGLKTPSQVLATVTEILERGLGLVNPWKGRP